MNPNALEFFSRSPEQTRRLGIRLGTHLQKGDTIYLSGDLGAGKTTFVQGVAQGWGSTDSVTSPTFVLINQYRRPDGLLINHLDAYRLENSAEAEELDVALMLEEGVLIVEWPERIKQALPSDGLWVEMRWMDDLQRAMVFSAHGERSTELLKAFWKHVVRS